MYDLKKIKKYYKVHFKGRKKYKYLHVTCFAKTYNWHFKNELFIQTLELLKK